MLYNWQYKTWPHFIYDSLQFEAKAAFFYEKAGFSTGIWQNLNETSRDETLITLLVQEAIKSSAIEGEMISREDVLSSIKKNLGFPVPSAPVKDLRSAGIAAVLVDSRLGFAEDLNKEKLFEWHTTLLQTTQHIALGQWRTHTKPMQVVSGAMGFEKVHFEAPPSKRVPDEMEGFIRWFNDTKPGGKRAISNPLIRTALVHLYFESIHPFEDGNGRIGRILAEKALSQHLGRPVLLSLSATIASNKGVYYKMLEASQKDLDCTDWIHYFSEVVLLAQTEFITSIEFSLKKAHFFDHYKALLNARQLKAVQRMLEEGENGFKGGMNVRKYLGINKISKATATRDLQDLVDKKVLIATGEGRATNYQVQLRAPD
jgi:Fic family protein